MLGRVDTCPAGALGWMGTFMTAPVVGAGCACRPNDAVDILGAGAAGCVSAWSDDSELYSAILIHLGEEVLNGAFGGPYVGF